MKEDIKEVLSTSENEENKVDLKEKKEVEKSTVAAKKTATKENETDKNLSEKK